MGELSAHTHAVVAGKYNAQESSSLKLRIIVILPRAGRQFTRIGAFLEQSDQSVISTYFTGEKPAFYVSAQETKRGARDLFTYE
jgi:hypothetical protein